MEILKKEVEEIEKDILHRLKTYQDRYSQVDPVDAFKPDISVTANDIDEADDTTIDNSLLKILSPTVKRDLLRLHSIKTARYKSNTDDIKEYASQIKSILDSYKAHGTTHIFEDDCWILHYKGSKRYKLSENEAIVENTISQIHMGNRVVHKFLSDLIESLDNKNFKTQYKLIHSATNGLAFVVVSIVAIS